VKALYVATTNRNNMKDRRGHKKGGEKMIERSR
jgi:hypothetical protein